nr:hypothetical protein [uncultured Undibacterium sp.]
MQGVLPAKQIKTNHCFVRKNRREKQDKSKQSSSEKKATAQLNDNCMTIARICNHLLTIKILIKLNTKAIYDRTRPSFCRAFGQKKEIHT